jgi:hypothetical protein
MKTRFSSARTFLAIAVLAVAVRSLGVRTGLLLGIPVAGIVFLDHAIRVAALVTAASLYLGAGTLPCLVVASGLSLEYLVRLWIHRRSRQLLASHQFTVAEMMAVITSTAAVLSLSEILGPATFRCLAIAMVVVALIIEPFGNLGWQATDDHQVPGSSDQPRRGDVADHRGVWAED